MNRTTFFYFNKNIYKPIKNISLGVSMNKKAVSPVIAVLLLVVIAVAAAIITYVWLTGYIGTLQQQSGTQQLQERLKIEGIRYSAGKLYIYVRNIGDVKVNITSAYLLYTNGTILKASIKINTELDPGSIDTSNVYVDLSGVSLDVGKTYIVKVVTEKGTEFSYQFVYRG